MGWVFLLLIVVMVVAVIIAMFLPEMLFLSQTKGCEISYRPARFQGD
jgi:hypothetical protein